MRHKMVANLEQHKQPGCPRPLQEVPEIELGLEAFCDQEDNEDVVIAKKGKEKAK